MDDDDAIIGLGLLIIGIALFIYGVIILMVIWFVISAIFGYIQYKKYRRESEEEYDEIAREIGIDLPVDEILEAPTRRDNQQGRAQILRNRAGPASRFIHGKGSGDADSTPIGVDRIDID